MEFFEQMNHWHWLTLGLLLLAGELLGTAGYFLWIGLSAVAVGALYAVIPLSWQMQWISFAVFSLFTTWLWWRYQHKKDISSDAKRALNQKDKQLIGQTSRLEEDIHAGSCRIVLGDTTWSAKSAVDIEKGTLVRVVSVDGIILTIEPVKK
ncbi:NfeD family protein [Aliivibrio fischeri]|uniref:NfeD-like C-terminal domain-containing protein n=2 Tax=Aliivibrio fischeri TaxID=668 RepID=Q5E159_ALIF1|nr:NfeD family protein [Aliivibrio fischeri]AAW87237.1 hypothetical protein VF_A0167 [Aliivibrio fischeri ES114]KLU80879.1 hypothetical protein AB192_03345 [Aliivibrio fischeri]MCE7555437.1 NfeD family protein [Aliivibrio fischeri]MCE7562705.1 NfeD family protein [Aliivibrio fischeri]MCE7565799.1 NfeD family protein [Aliivibrio fischeri]